MAAGGHEQRSPSTARDSDVSVRRPARREECFQSSEKKGQSTLARHIRGEMARESVEECPRAEQCGGLCCNVVSNVGMSGTDFSDKF